MTKLEDLRVNDTFVDPYLSNKRRKFVTTVTEPRPEYRVLPGGKKHAVHSPAVSECPTDPAMIHLHTSRGRWCAPRSQEVETAQEAESVA